MEIVSEVDMMSKSPMISNDGRMIVLQFLEKVHRLTVQAKVEELKSEFSQSSAPIRIEEVFPSFDGDAIRKAILLPV
jgi:hypothetical protein